MEDLPRLRIARRVIFVRLRRRQKAQHASRERRIHPECLQGGDQSVASEGRREPWHAGIGIRSVLGVGHEHADVGHRAAQGIVDRAARCLERRCLPSGIAQVSARQANGDQRSAFEGARVSSAVNGHEDRAPLLRRQLELEHRSIRRELVRLRREVDVRRPRDPIERGVLEPCMIRRAYGFAHRAAPLAGKAAYFEHIDEVGIEVQREPDRAWPLIEVPHGDDFITGGVPQELHARDVDRVPRQLDRVAAQEIRVHEIHIEHRVVALNRGAQQERRMPFDRKAQARKKADVLVVHALGARRLR